MRIGQPNSLILEFPLLKFYTTENHNSQPEMETLSQPEMETVSQPEKEHESEPRQCEPEKETVSQPEKETVSQPEKETVSQPEKETVSQPEKETVSQPEKEHESEPRPEMEHELESKINRIPKQKISKNTPLVKKSVPASEWNNTWNTEELRINAPATIVEIFPNGLSEIEYEEGKKRRKIKLAELKLRPNSVTAEVVQSVTTKAATIQRKPNPKQD